MPRQLLSELASGDAVMVTRLDRLALSPCDLLNTLAAITTGKKADFKSIGEAWADNHHGAWALDVDCTRRGWRSSNAT
jgi:hypothetical protein